MTDLAQTPTVWDAARRDYLSGVPVAEICGRYKVGRSAFYTRAQAGGWRRREVFYGPPDYELIEPPDRSPQPARSRQQMACEAMDRADQALRLGRLHEARGWLRLVRELRRMAAEEVGVASWREVLHDTLERDMAEEDDPEADDWFEDEGWAAPVADAASDAASDTRPAAATAVSDCRDEETSRFAPSEPDSPDTFSASGSGAIEDPADFPSSPLQGLTRKAEPLAPRGALA